MWFFDSGFIIFVLPAMLFALYAQAKVKSAYYRYSQIAARSRLSGGQVARELLRHAGLDDVRVLQTEGNLTDHYDPRSREVKLSAPVFQGNSLASLGIAAHEVGHALQHAGGYAPLAIRNAIVPLAGFGSRAAFPLFFIGFLFSAGEGTLGFLLMDIGIAVFFFAVLFQAVTLPVEFNASRRALASLAGGGYLQGHEIDGAREVLNAAALTYIAAMAVALAQLFRLLFLRNRH
ncbi:MAG: zinc metallopeptidase [Bacillota bacterium]